ncbi:non-specific serine/threonine protein kinase [Variovorax sp. HW608]|uniref:DEAD/DEAH box helicase n=1 Tax=Variovorax sp. HW608 TaxID=1034889 RepID=UPI0008201174|nr:DEAD/DEAH box helicase [Variovorax sp. HW608]SCK37128.1 non-specific serine/threonine protein kinase [Variovorax sp. HW608]
MSTVPTDQANHTAHHAASLAPLFTPHGRLTLVQAEDVPSLEVATAARLQEAFARGSGLGLLQLGAGEVATALPAVLSYWRDFATRYVTALCTLPDADENGAKVHVAPPAYDVLASLADAAPPMAGAEYVTGTALASLWQELDTAFASELLQTGSTVQEFLRRHDPAWNLVGRVHFNLAENRKDEEAPFAFVATYTTRLSKQAKAQHLPLGRALQEYADASNQELLSLLLPVQRAAEQCAWLKAMVDSGEIFHPLRWTPQDAFALLRDAQALEAAGIVLRMPARWRTGRPARPQVTAILGTASPSKLGTDALLDFRMDVTLEGETLSAGEITELLAESDGLALVRGQWVEVDHKKLAATLEHFEQVEQAASSQGLSFGDAMRMLARADAEGSLAAPEVGVDWSQVMAGPWLAQTLQGLRSPQALESLDPGPALRATLRPYQQVGVRWLHLLARLGLGACLADDMGLGKTIQVLSLLLVLKNQVDARTPAKPSLLVAPASLLANWASEIARFAPSLKLLLAHPSALAANDLTAVDAARLAQVDLVITSYGTLLRLPWLKDTAWRLVVIDEAQAIKNPNAKQTRAVKQLGAEARIALTGTPVENRLGDLWSIFDFINPGLLGSSKQFAALVKQLVEREHNPYGPLRELVRPYILRRMKTDKSVIADLPDKTEVKAYCPLSRKQAALYEAAVQELATHLEQTDGIRRRGVVLAALMRFKQICNHPSQWLGDNAWAEDDSGKWARLRELAEVIAAKQEKVLVFTQFREMTAPIATFLASVFGRSGLVLHGETEVKKRHELVRRFQDDEEIPFFVLSLKAGGAGLNLTAASHVIHFDRWWNPAVENQATDRAFRIGQKKNVLVHKFVCRGTVEEKIDELIESKRQLSSNLLEGGAELMLTEMKDDELLKLVALDIHTAMEET